MKPANSSPFQNLQKIPVSCWAEVDLGSEARPIEIHSIDSFLGYWASVRGRTSRIVRAIPPEHIEWTYRPGKFTFGDLVRHLAALERYMFAENARGRPSRYPGHGEDLASGYDTIVEYFDKMHEETVDILRSLPDSRLQETCETPGGAKLRVWKWLRAMIEHEVHHRGQIYLYLGILDVDTPPLYGLTSEQVLERSDTDRR